MSKNTRKDARISVEAYLEGTNNTSGSGPPLSIGGFDILVIDHYSLQLNLTPNCNKSVITVFGNIDIEVEVQGRDQLLIRPLSGGNYVLAGRAEYEIGVLSYDGFKDEVIISLNYKPTDQGHYLFNVVRGFIIIIELSVIFRYRKCICRVDGKTTKLSESEVDSTTKLSESEVDS